jgi:hypothetical protein
MADGSCAGGTTGGEDVVATPKDDQQVCPSCHATSLVRVARGYPTPETMDAAERGEVVLGGCMVGADVPELACRSCGYPGPRRR